LEIIVVDDGSTDGTRAALQPEMGRIRYYHQHNMGTAAARNTGIRKARGELIAFLDNDDIWMHEKIAFQVHASQIYPDVGLVFTDGCIVGEHGTIKKSMKPVRLENWIEKSNKDSMGICKGLLTDEFFLGNIISTATCVLIRKKCLDAVGLFDEKIHITDDFDLWLRFALNFPVAFIDRQLCIWRYRRDSASGPQDGRHLLYGKASIGVLEKHLQKADSSIREKIRLNLAEMYRKCGLIYFRRDDFHNSRQMFYGSLQYNKHLLYSYLYILATHLGPNTIDAVRRLRKKLAAESQSARTSTRTSPLRAAPVMTSSSKLCEDDLKLGIEGRFTAKGSVKGVRE
jgi:glycosyltransferase involved in cell wall biosynthesis